MHLELLYTCCAMLKPISTPRHQRRTHTSHLPSHRLHRLPRIDAQHRRTPLALLKSVGKMQLRWVYGSGIFANRIMTSQSSNSSELL